MKVLPLAAAALLLTAGAALSDDDIDLAAFGNGALIAQASSSYGGSWEPIWLLDENPSLGWATAKGDKAPFNIVISLPEQSEVHSLEFDTASVELPERSSKDVDVMISDKSATDGFTLLATVKLTAADKQVFPVATPGKGRWLKLVVKSNGGDPDYAEIMDFKAFGKQLTTSPLPNVSGTYDSAHVRQVSPQPGRRAAERLLRARFRPDPGRPRSPI